MQHSQLTRIKASAKAIDVGALMHAAADLVAPLVAAKGLTCAFQSPGDRISLNSDPVKVRQILVNLANAVKFTDPGG